MSTYTDFAHEWVLNETLRWSEQPPHTPQEWYGYGEYRYRLAEYRTAVSAYARAAEGGSSSARFRLAYCISHALGQNADFERCSDELFQSVLERDIDSTEPDARYRVGMCLTYGWGTERNEPLGFSAFQQISGVSAEAQYEIGLFYRDGRGEISRDFVQAEKWLRRAYDGFCEEAIFALFELYDRDFTRFPYQREIKEGYSFRLGRLMRAAECDPCPEYWKRLADFYRFGYPGDTGQKLEKFQRMAQKYEKKAGISNAK